VRAVHRVAEVRAAEQSVLAGLPPGTLMQRAAAGLAAEVLRRLPRVYGTRVSLLVGGGDNGADTLWAGARLAARGARVDAVLVSDRHAGTPALAALHAAGGRSHGGHSDGGARVLADTEVVLDGLVGIGGRGALRPEAAALAGAANGSGAFVVAVDVPSGVDPDTGAVEGEAVRADLTVTFGTGKPGLVLAPGSSYAGDVVLVDIGLGPQLPEPAAAALDDADVARLLPCLTADSNKYRRGVLGVAAGGTQYTGAAVLCVGGALAQGVGMVRYAGPASPAELVRHRWPEVVVTEVAPGDGDAVLAAGRVQAWVVGPGLGTDDGSRAVLAAVLGTDVPVLVDADGLTLLARDPGLLPGRAAPTLLTPHTGEFERLTGVPSEQAEADRLGVTTEAARRLGATVLLKGSATVVAGPGGRVLVATAGTPALATAGSGDVLAGVAGSLLAAGLPPLEAAAAAAHLHGLAGRLAAEPVSAGDLPGAWPLAVGHVRAAAR
jgi:hydroxyethylthiazole kinase-like uncharacterized protein yjeF